MKKTEHLNLIKNLPTKSNNNNSNIKMTGYIKGQLWGLLNNHAIVTNPMAISKVKTRKPIINFANLKTVNKKIYTRKEIIQHLQNWKEQHTHISVTARCVAETFLGLDSNSNRRNYRTKIIKAQRLLEKQFNNGFFAERIKQSPTQYVF